MEVDDEEDNTTNSKRPLDDPTLTSSSSYSKKPKPVPEDDILSNFSLDDELSKLLESPDPETTPFPSQFKVRFVPYPYSAPLDSYSSSSYVTINGNEESCGSSFSDADSSFMASVDTCDASRTVSFFGAEVGGAWALQDEVGRENGWDWDDAFLAGFMAEEEEREKNGEGVFGSAEKKVGEN